MAITVGELVYKVTGDTSGVSKSLKETDNQAKKTGTSFNRLRLGAIAVGVAVGGAVVALTRMVRNQLNVIDASAKMADKLGISMEAMTGLEHIAGLTGTSAEQLATAMQSLEVRLGQAEDGTGKAESALRQLGLRMEDVTELDSDKAFFKVAESLQAVEDRTQQAYLAQELFGRQGRELLGVIRSSGGSLSDMSKEAERLGLTMSRSAAAEVEKFNDNMFRLTQRSEGAKRQFTVSLMPSLNDLSRALLSASENGGVLQLALDGISGITESVIKSITALIEQVNKLTGTASEIELLNVSIRGTEAAIDRLNRQYEKGWVNQKNYTDEKTKLIAKLEEERKKREELIKGEEASKPKPIIIPRTGAPGKSSTEKELTDLEKLKKSAQDYNDNILENRLKKARSILNLANAEGNAQDQAYAQAQVRELEEEKINKVLQERIAIINNANMAISAGTNLLQSFGALAQAQGERRLAQLDAQEQRALEAAGVAEESRIMQLESEIREAEAAGNIELANEKKKELKRAKIQEEFEKKRRQVEYETALQSWEIQRILAVAQGAQAVLNAYSSAAAIPVVGFKIAPFAAALAGLAAGVQIAAINASKPQPPAFAEGGIVPGTSFSGDNITARVNSGEMVLNSSQQARLFEMANGAGGAGNISVYLGDELIYKNLYKASQRGDLIIDARGIVTR